MNTKHTPGQWEALLHTNGAFDILATDEKGAELALANKGPMTSRAEEMHANAHLIAAAPELLEALKAGKHLINVVRMPNAEYVADAHNAAVETIRAAIDKAEGGGV